MTQEYLNHLFENYTAVEKFYWTADGTAFKNPEEAKAYSKILGNPLVKVLDHGGQLENAVDADLVDEPLGNTAGEYIDDTPTGDGNKEAAPAVDYDAMNVATLKELCASREIALNGATKKADIIALLVAADKAAAGDPGAVDYSTLDMEQLKAICTERNIAVDEADDEAALVVKLLAFDASL